MIKKLDFPHAVTLEPNHTRSKFRVMKLRFGNAGIGASLHIDDKEIAWISAVELAEFLALAADVQMEILHNNGKL